MSGQPLPKTGLDLEQLLGKIGGISSHDEQFTIQATAPLRLQYPKLYCDTQLVSQLVPQPTAEHCVGVVVDVVDVVVVVVVVDMGQETAKSISFQ
jgi:hypothetical protein